MKEHGFEFVNLVRKMNVDMTKSKPKKPGYEGFEIYKDKDGSCKYRISENHMFFLRAAYNHNFIISAQISGAPPCFPKDPNYYPTPDDMKADKDYRLPDPAYWTDWALATVQWIEAMEKLSII